jgi:hypothetical protein
MKSLHPAGGTSGELCIPPLRAVLRYLTPNDDLGTLGHSDHCRPMLARSPDYITCIMAHHMREQPQVTLAAIVERINEIDRKFVSTEPWLHSTLSKLAREREQLVALSNAKFATNLKHEWR